LWVSTRGSGKPATFSEAMLLSVPREGGLFVPASFPRLEMKDFSGLDRADSIVEIAEKLLGYFFDNDPLESELASICRAAFNFPIPLTPLDSSTEILELFHGPTLAFKDVGARFLAECVTRIPQSAKTRRTVLVATSGDTGGAVAAAFHEKSGIDVAILFPKGRISPEQEKQLTCWGGNIHAFSVRGDFDDCQRVVKEAFNSPDLKSQLSLISANSINVGRLLPQTVYYAASSLWYLRRHGKPPGYVIPSGNLGNAVAAFWARKMGFPIREIKLATNANRTLTAYYETGVFKSMPTIATLANAMDVGNPNNMERLLSIHPDWVELRKISSVVSVNDQAIRETITQGALKWKRDFCPHTATAIHAREKSPSSHWIIVATAHAAKFASVVGFKIDIPPALNVILKRESHSVEIEARLEDLRTQLI
jgi:threonine synthase